MSHIKFNRHHQTLARLEVYIPNRKHAVAFVPIVNRIEYVQSEITYLKHLSHEPRYESNRCNMNKRLSRELIKLLNKTAVQLYDEKGNHYGYDFQPDLTSLLHKKNYYPQTVMLLIEEFMDFSEQFQFNPEPRQLDADGFKLTFNHYDLLIDLYQVIKYVAPLGNWNFDMMYFKSHSTPHVQGF